MITVLNENISFVYRGPHRIENTQGSYVLMPFTVKGNVILKK